MFRRVLIENMLTRHDHMNYGLPVVAGLCILGVGKFKEIFRSNLHPCIMTGAAAVINGM
jgi:hypothetical protein